MANTLEGGLIGRIKDYEVSNGEIRRRDWRETPETLKVEDSSLKACNARTLDRLRDLQQNTGTLWDILRQLGGNTGEVGPSPSNNVDKQPPEPTHPLFQARQIEQRLAQEIDIQRQVMEGIRSLIG